VTEKGGQHMSAQGVPAFSRMPSCAALVEREARSEPAVYRGGAEAWPALSLWTGPAGTDYLCSRHGEVIVDVAVSGDRTFSGDVRCAQSVSVPFKDFLRGDVLSSLARDEGCEGGAAGGCHADSDLVFYLAQCPLYASSAPANAGGADASAVTENLASPRPASQEGRQASPPAAAGQEERQGAAQERQEGEGARGGAGGSEGGDKACSAASDWEDTASKTCLEALLSDICVPQAQFSQIPLFSDFMYRKYTRAMTF
jgi:hypothetical protein